MTTKDMVPDKLFKSCFISAPFGVDLKNLTQVLDEQNIQWEWAKSDDGYYSERLPGDLRKIIRGADFVIGVFFGGSHDANTMFEVGVCVGAGKPLLLLLAEAADVPFNLRSVPQLRAPLTDKKAIEFHLDLFMRSSISGFRFPTSGKKPVAGPPMPKKPVRNEMSASEGYAFEREVAKLIEDAGGTVSLHPEPPDDPAGSRVRADLLFWLSTKDAELLNPAVVELKSSRLTRQDLARAEEQVSAFLQKTGVSTGIIILKHALTFNAISDFRPHFNVFVLDLETFRRLLETGSLAEHLRMERNRAAHGLR